MAQGAGRPTRVAAVGFDAVEWPLVESMIGEGELPNLARMVASGTTCRLRNEKLHRTSLVWDAFLGHDPDPDDRFSAGIAFDPATYGTYKVGAAVQRSFVDAIDGSLVALDVPYLSLSGREPSARVCVWGGHIDSHPRGSQPPDLLPRIDAEFGTDPAAGVDQHAWHSRRGIDRFVRALVAAATRRARIGTWLASLAPDWRLLLIVQHEGHAAAECFAYVLDPEHPLASIPTAPVARSGLYDVYRALDAGLGTIAASLPEDTALVAFSLHGLEAGGPDLAATVLLPELLHRLEYGEACLDDPDQVEWARAGYPPVVPDSGATWSEYLQERWRPDPRGRPSLLARATRRMVRGIRRRESHGEARSRPRLPIDRVNWPLTHGVARRYRAAWPRMRAFALPSFADGRIRLNLHGRERDGVVPVADYEHVCEDLELLVRECRNPRTGEPVTTGITRPRARDPLAPDGPDADLVIEWSGCVDAIEHPTIGMIGPFPFLRTAAHTPHGFFVATGPDVEHRDLGERPAAELAPMIRDLLREGSPAPSADGERAPRLLG
jgi:predicted AlkP superfamily phosphohydrolase/phosphomutase